MKSAHGAGRIPCLEAKNKGRDAPALNQLIKLVGRLEAPFPFVIQPFWALFQKALRVLP